METCAPLYERGQRVQAAADLLNDGSYPEQPSEALLVQSGEAGEVVQVGHTATLEPLSTWLSLRRIESWDASKTN
jgi:nitrogen fixation protein NifZ